MKLVEFEYADIDFETRSKADIREVGAWKYSEHPSTEVLIMRWSIDGETTHQWLYGNKPPRKLFRWLKQKKNRKIRAFNSMFEYCIWINVCVPKLDWPEFGLEKFYDAMANSCAKAFPANLEGAGEAMELDVTKDKEGKRLIQKFSKPISSGKLKGEFRDPKLHWDDFLRFDEYCDIDVLTQIGVAEFAGELSEFEYQVWLLTEVMNARGLPIDMEMVEGALDLIQYATKRNNKEAKKITGEDFELSQRDAVLNWLCNNGLPLPDMQKQTVERTLKKKDLPKKARRVLELRFETNKTSTAKYSKAKQMICKDGRVHESLKYHIAKTGRWGGRGLQIQNFARPTLPKWVDYEFLVELIKDRDHKLIEILYGGVIDVLSSALRSMICAPKGYKLVCADYAQIEVRVAFWFAGEKKALDIFRQGGDIYCDMASDIYGFKVTKANDFERFIGKQCILGLGFQMGAPKFKKDLYDKADVAVELKFAKNAVDTYRKKYSKVKKMWNEVNEAAINAVLHKGKKFYCCDRKIHYVYDGDFLYCVLPSSRKLSYFQPKVEEVPPPKSWNSDKMLKQLTFMGIDTYTKKWTRLKTYGGSLVENFVQATARDIMAHGMLNAESKGYPQLFTVHDESASMVKEDFGSVKEYEKILSEVPAWANGIPVAAEGWESRRYRK